MPREAPESEGRGLQTALQEVCPRVFLGLEAGLPRRWVFTQFPNHF